MLVQKAMDIFYQVREVPGLKKKPSTSELIDWLKLLLHEDMPLEVLQSKDPAKAIPPLHGALLKNEQDVMLFERLAFMSAETGRLTKPAAPHPLRARPARARARDGVRAAGAAHLYEFLLFGFKQGWACLFGALMLALLIATHLFYPQGAWLPRYDFLAAGGVRRSSSPCSRFRLETWDEAKVILAFHVAGTVMEVFKTAYGFVDLSRSRLICGSAACRSSRASCMPRSAPTSRGSGGSSKSASAIIRRSGCPPCSPLGIYVNFFAHHWLSDARYRAARRRRRLIFWRTQLLVQALPPLPGDAASSSASCSSRSFIWFAENIGTLSPGLDLPEPAPRLGTWCR